MITSHVSFTKSANAGAPPADASCTSVSILIITCKPKQKHHIAFLQTLRGKITQLCRTAHITLTLRFFDIGERTLVKSYAGANQLQGNLSAAITPHRPHGNSLHLMCSNFAPQSCAALVLYGFALSHSPQFPAVPECFHDSAVPTEPGLPW